MNEGGLDVGVSDAIEIATAGVARIDGVLGNQRQIRSRDQNPRGRQIESMVIAEIECLCRYITRVTRRRSISVLKLKQVWRRAEKIQAGVVGD